MNRRHAILDFDLVDLLSSKLAGDRRPPDGLLHPSGDLLGSLRHAQLRAAGAPTLESDVVSDTRLMIGTLTHRWLEDCMRGQLVINEVKLDRFLPEGWTGTADALFWNAEKRGFVLTDYKTIKPEGMTWISRDGMKTEHLWQASVYWHACVAAGLPMVNGFVIFYIPTNQLLAKDGAVSPMVAEGTPLPGKTVGRVMHDRWTQTRAYLATVHHDNIKGKYDADWLTPALAPVQERIVKLTLNKTAKRPVINVSFVPHWSAQFCPYPNELCDCRTQTVNKIGHWDRNDAGLLEYVPREDMPQPVSPIPDPDDKLINALVKAQKEKT